MSYRMTPMIVLPLLVLLACPVAGSCQTSKPGKPPITVSKETTWITEPLNADGTVNYVAAADAWLSKGVTRENNAAILILQAFGRDAINEKVRDAIIKRLELTDFLDANTALIGVSNYASEVFGEDNSYDAGSKIYAAMSKLGMDPFSADVDLTALAGYVKRNDRALDLLVEATKRPRYYMPYVSPSKPPRTVDGICRVSLRGCVHAPGALGARAFLRVREGKIDADLGDIIAIRKLGRLVGQETTLLEGLISLGLEQKALGTMIGLATSGRLDQPQAKALLANLCETPAFPMPSDLGNPIERFLVLDQITRWARDGMEMGTRQDSNNADPEPDVTVPDVKIDYDLLCRLTNEGIAKAQAVDAMPTFSARNKAREALSTPTSPAVKEALDVYRNPFKMQTGLVKLFQRAGTADPQRLAQLISECESSASGISPVGKFVETTRAWAILARLSAALAVYRAEHGRYPDKLDALAPGLIQAVPGDPFNDKPLTYRLTDKGYILYSVGKDMKDDGGKTRGFFRDEPDMVVEAK